MKTTRSAWWARGALVAAELATQSCTGEPEPEAAADAGAPEAAAQVSGSPGCAKSTWPANSATSIDVAGTARSFIVEAPASYSASTKYNVVLAFHGFTRTAEQTAAEGYVGLAALSQDDAIFVAPQGLDTTLLGQVAPGWDNTGGRDIAFVRALITWLRANYCIDDARVFSAGVSMGGYMANQVGCELHGEVRAVASLMGGGPLPLNGVQCTTPMAAFIAHGNQDVINAFSQGEKSRDHWREANHCSTTRTPTGLAMCATYDGCDPGYPVTWCEYDGGHVVPDFAAQGMWSFFSSL